MGKAQVKSDISRGPILRFSRSVVVARAPDVASAANISSIGGDELAILGEMFREDAFETIRQYVEGSR